MENTERQFRPNSEEVLEKILFENDSSDEDDLAEVLSSDSKSEVDDDDQIAPSTTGPLIICNDEPQTSNENLAEASLDFCANEEIPTIEGIQTNEGIQIIEEIQTNKEIQPNDETEIEESTANPTVVAQNTAVLPQQRRRKAKKLIDSLDEALDENKYDLMRFSASVEPKQYVTILEPAKSKNCGRKITWTNNPPNSVGQQCAANLVRGNTGVRTEYRSVTNERKAWELFFTANIVSMIVENTNKKIEKLRNDIFSATRGENTSRFYSYMGYVSSSEIFAFIELMYLRGLLGLANHKINVLFNNLTGNDIFGATMSKNRFAFLYTHITFDNITSRPERWLYDRFAAFREIFEHFNHNCSRCIIPDEYLSLDETLYPMRVEIGIKQFNPNEPAKYGILFKSINACRYPYTFTAYAYAGRPRKAEEPDKCAYYIRGTENTVKWLVEKLQSYATLSGRNITYDRLYTSIPLAEWLLVKTSQLSEPLCQTVEVFQKKLNRLAKGIQILMKSFRMKLAN